MSCLDEKALRWVAGACIERVVPRLAEAFGYGATVVAPDLVLADLFVARYSVDGQRALEHEDGRDAVSSSNAVDGVTFVMRHRSPFAFVVPLNDGFEGGGTQFVQIEGAPIFRPAVGAALLFLGRTAIGESPRQKACATSWRDSPTCAAVDKRTVAKPVTAAEIVSAVAAARGAAASPESRRIGAAAFARARRAARPVLQRARAG